MTVDLDTRMRAAGDSLVRASERLSPAAPPRSLRPLAGVVTGVVVVAALAAGTVTVLAVRDGDGESTVASGSGVARLVPDVVPDGLRSSGVVELPDDADAGPGLSVSVYGDPAADDPFAQADLALYTTAVPVEPDQLDQLGDTDPVPVRGHTGFVDGYMPEGVLLIWQEAPGLSIGMGSRTLDLGQLQAIAEGLVVDADTRTVDLGPVPNGIAGTLAPVGSVDDFGASPALAPLVPPIPASGDGHVGVYQPEEYGGFGAAFVAEFTGDANDLAVVRWMSGAGTAAEVRGHPGWVGSYELPPFDDGEGIVPGSEGLFVSTLVWEEAPGVLVLVQTVGPDADDARAMAESLRPAAEDEWASLVRLGRSSDTRLSDEERVAEGQVPVQDRFDAAARITTSEDARNEAEGVYGVAGAWATWIESDGTLCGAVDTVDDDADPVETCDPEGGPATTVHDHDGRPALLIGVMPDGAVGRYTTDGEIEEAQTVTGPDEAPPYYVMAIADGAVPTAVTFVDADGTEMTTVPVDP